MRIEEAKATVKPVCRSCSGSCRCAPLKGLTYLDPDLTMCANGTELETDSAHIRLIAPQHIEQHFKVHALFSAGAFERNRLARKKVSKGVPCVVMIVIPKEIPVDPRSANEDHFRQESQDRSILALAVVVKSELMSAVSKFYFQFYQSSFEVRVMTDAEEAGVWLGSVLADRRTASPRTYDRPSRGSPQHRLWAKQLPNR